MIVVTGANGFIGSALVGEFQKKWKNEVFLCIDTIPLTKHNLLNNKVNILFAETKNTFVKLEEFKGQISYFVHMGACSSTTEKSWTFLKENNLEYSKKVFKWCVKNKVPLIYASSAATYGDGKLGFSDTTNFKKLKPLNLYGKSKLLFDIWVQNQKSTPPYFYGLRFFNVFGPNENYKEHMASMIFKSFQKLKTSNTLNLFKSHKKKYKDGEQLRDFIYIKDISRWVIEIIEKKPESGIYNLGTGKAESWNTVAKAIIKHTKKQSKIEFVDMPEDIKKHYQYFTEADMSKWFSQKMSKPIWNIEKAVKDYIKNYLTKSKII